MNADARRQEKNHENTPQVIDFLVELPTPTPNPRPPTPAIEVLQ